jgi:hypothetical protein
MKTIGVAALLILSAHWTLASNFDLPTLKYDQREPGSLPSVPASGRSAIRTPWSDAAKTLKPRPVSGRIDRDGIIVPTTPLRDLSGDSRNLDLIDRDFKLRIDQAPKVDQGMIAAPDAQRSGLTSR